MSSLGARLKAATASADSALVSAAITESRRGPAAVGSAVSQGSPSTPAVAEAWAAASSFTAQPGSDVQQIKHGIDDAPSLQRSASQRSTKVDWATLKTAARDADAAQTRRLFGTISPSRTTAPHKSASSVHIQHAGGSPSASFHQFAVASLPNLPKQRREGESIPAGKNQASSESRYGVSPTRSHRSSTAPNHNSNSSGALLGQYEQLGLTRASMQSPSPSPLLLKKSGRTARLSARG